MHTESELLILNETAPQGWRALNAPIQRGSTIVFDNFETFVSRDEQLLEGYSYGQNGSPTTYELSNWISRLEGGAHTVLVPSGLAAITLVNALCAETGCQILIPDCIYGPTGDSLSSLFARWGIETVVYPANVGANIAQYLNSRVKLVWTESPGSNTMIMQDIPAIVQVAQVYDIPVAMDNTWATPLYFSPLSHGVTFTVQALTKYIGGHSDILMGSVSVKSSELFRKLRMTSEALGYYVSPDECSLVLRGAGTLSLRMQRHAQSALYVANWLLKQPKIASVNYPALPSDQGHAIWKRDYRGAAGVLSFRLICSDRLSIQKFVDHLQVFKIGASWGGLHSLVAPIPNFGDEENYFVRLHIGLEHQEDLVKDLHNALGCI